MNREERAKQFMAFDALKGLREELQKREEKCLRENKKELTEEENLLLSQKMAVLRKGDYIKVTFFYAGHYVNLTGRLQGVNLAYKYISINDNCIAFEDILQIENVNGY